MIKITRVAQDTFPDLPITITDSTNAAVNLTGCTVKFVIQNSATKTETNSAANTCTITSPTAGLASYSFAATDLPSAGVYLCDVRVTFPSTKVQTAYSQVQIIVRDRA